MSDKPKPIRRHERKQLGWTRERAKGFLLPRLNEPQTDVQAVGFIDWRSVENNDDDAASR